MSDFEDISFVIPGYTPETMPLNRLIDYLQQMAVVLGDPENLHLIEIRKSSTAPVLRTPIATAIAAGDRARRIQRGEGTRRQTGAYNRIRHMLRQDAGATVQRDRPALLRTTTQVLLEIPAAPKDTGVVEGLRQFTTIDGQLTRVGGAGEDAALQVQQIDGRILSGFTAKRALAKELATLLYEPVRLMGIGQWYRDEEAHWTLDRMLVQGYERLEDEDALVTLERLRKLDVKWPSDTWDTLVAEREAGL
jgi:hypothetical protein